MIGECSMNTDLSLLHIYKAVPEDLPRIMEIYASARAFMAASGNPAQWGDAYPYEDIIREDIALGRCYVVADAAPCGGDDTCGADAGGTEASGIHGVFALCEGAEPSYAQIDGAWLDDDAPYVCVHRVAGDGRVHGIMACIMAWVKERYDNVRIDTHEDNKIMQGLILKNGFSRCGIIRLENGDSRISYQWLREEA